MRRETIQFTSEADHESLVKNTLDCWLSSTQNSPRRTPQESLWTYFLMCFLTRNSIPCESIKSFFTFRVMTVRIKQTMMHYSKNKPFKYDPTDSFTRFTIVIVNCNLFMLKAYKALFNSSTEHFASCFIAAQKE